MDGGLPLRTLKARWDLSSEGYVEPNRNLLIDLTFRLAAILQPGFAPPRANQQISSSLIDADDYGGSLLTLLSRIGDKGRGLEIIDIVSNANDGMTPFEATATIKVYGLPDGCTLELFGLFVAPLFGRPNPVTLEARVTDKAARPIANILRAEFGATIEER